MTIYKFWTWMQAPYFTSHNSQQRECLSKLYAKFVRRSLLFYGFKNYF